MLRIPQLTQKDLIRFWSKVDKKGPDDCWEWTASVDKGGYGKFKLNGYMYRAHRISYAIANGDPGEINVNHLHDNPPCVNPAHLWLGTQQEGIDDKLNKNRGAYGKQQGSAKLTEKQVKEILESNETHQALADKYGVCNQIISAVKRGRLWKHVKGRRTTIISPYGNSQTRVRGVDSHKATGKYQARITYKRVRYYLGLFKTVAKAEQALNKWKEKHELC